VTSIHRTATVPYPPHSMFELVDHVEAYPEFLPWCRSTRVHARDRDEVRASIEMARGSLDKVFTTRNLLRPHKMIEMRLIDGPFRHLEGFWTFEARGQHSCQVTLDLEFEFANRFMSMALGPIFQSIANSLVDSFVRRARDLYGREARRAP